MDAKLEHGIGMHPDKIWTLAKSGTTFIYTIRHNLYTEDRRATHWDVMANPDLDDELIDLSGVKNPGRKEAENFALLGRIGNVDFVDICGFWYSNLIDQLLKPCIKTLIRDGFLKLDDVVSPPPYQNPKYASDIIGGFKPKELTPEEKENAEKEEAIHLAKNKKEILLAKGYKPKPPYKDLIPGQKLWALNSENFSFKDWLNYGR